MDLLGLSVTTGPYHVFVEKIIDFATSRKSSYICIANVHMLVEAYKDKQFAELINNADIVTPDGMPLVWSFKLLHGVKQDRVAGMDLLPDLLKQAEQDQISVYFYGGTEAIINKTRKILALQYPALPIAGLYSPPFRPLTETEHSEIVQNIRNSKAQLVFVVLGCPKQEKWMASMHGKINACMVGIGGALPVLIGAQKRAPIWMQKHGLEWLYRFFQEPSRLAKRYLVTNSIFLWLFFKAWVKQFFKKQHPGA